MYDVLLQGGEVIDPSQGLHEIASLAIQNGKIIALGEVKGEAKKVFDLKGKILSPGLIDLHCHPAYGFFKIGVPADEIGINTGVTLLCDGGSAGYANFETLRRFIVEKAETDIYCYLNLASTGLVKMPEIRTEHDFNIDQTKQVIEANSDIIKGVKLRATQALAEGIGIRAMETAKKLAKALKLPLMIHVGETRERLEKDVLDDFSRAVVSLMDEGDILSHYMTWEAGGLILKDGTVYPELQAAQKRGVILDPSLGLSHFSFSIARHAITNGFMPTIITTDMSSLGLPVVQSLTVSMSKFLNLGLTLYQVIAMTTTNPAKVLGLEKERGSLKIGMPADITILELVRGNYIFSDGKGNETLKGDVLLEPRMVFKGGEAKPAYSRYHFPPSF